jgi:alpha-amylase
MVMRRDGKVWINNVWASIFVEKTINLYPNRAFFDVIYRLENRSDSELEALFGIETAWSLLAGNSPDRYYHVDGKKPDNPTMLSTGVISNSNTIGLTDEALGYDIELISDRELDWWRFPVETVSLSESGFERNYQQSTVVPVMNIKLPRGQAFDLKLSFEINKL